MHDELVEEHERVLVVQSRHLKEEGCCENKSCGCHLEHMTSHKPHPLMVNLTFKLPTQASFHDTQTLS